MIHDDTLSCCFMVVYRNCGGKCCVGKKKMMLMKMMMDTLISLDTLEGNDNEVWQFLRYGNYFGVDVE